jgi:hypothetical protein
MATILRELGFYSKHPVSATSSKPRNWLPWPVFDPRRIE